LGSPERASSAKTADKLLCGVLLLLTAVEAGFAVVFSGYFAMASDACFDCDTSPIGVGIAVSQGGAALVWLAAVALSVRAWSRGRLSFYWPLMAGLAIPALFVLGGTIASTTGP